LPRHFAVNRGRQQIKLMTGVNAQGTQPRSLGYPISRKANGNEKNQQQERVQKPLPLISAG
jgi:hypothetical protein